MMVTMMSFQFVILSLAIFLRLSNPMVYTLPTRWKRLIGTILSDLCFQINRRPLAGKP